jgi:hypothetical protein
LLYSHFTLWWMKPFFPFLCFHNINRFSMFFPPLIGLIFFVLGFSRFFLFDGDLVCCLLISVCCLLCYCMSSKLQFWFCCFLILCLLVFWVVFLSVNQIKEFVSICLNELCFHHDFCLIPFDGNMGLWRKISFLIKLAVPQW